MEKSKNDWRAIVEAYKTSGQRQNEWCRENNVNLNNLRYWLQKEKKAAPTMPAAKEACQWLALDIPAPQSAAGQRLTIRIGQANLEITPGFDPQFLTDVIKVIIAAC
jgi:transposase-like protein